MRVVESEIMKEVGRTDFLSEATFADFPVDLLQEVKRLRREARAAGLSETEVEKISTCPLVRLLVREEA